MKTKTTPPLNYEGPQAEPILLETENGFAQSKSTPGEYEFHEWELN